jgi:hypothetical protein
MDFDQTWYHTWSLRESGTLLIFNVKGQGHWVKLFFHYIDADLLLFWLPFCFPVAADT